MVNSFTIWYTCATHGGMPLLWSLPPRFLLDRSYRYRPPSFLSHHPLPRIVPRASLLSPCPARPSGPLRRAVPHCLLLLVLGFELPLDIEVGLALALDALLLHVTDHTLVHCLMLGVVSYLDRDISNLLGGTRRRTCCSAFCWKCTNTTVLAAKSEVPSRVILEARDMVGEAIGTWADRTIAEASCDFSVLKLNPVRFPMLR